MSEHYERRFLSAPPNWLPVLRYNSEIEHFSYEPDDQGDHAVQVIIRAAAIVWRLFTSVYGMEKLRLFIAERFKQTHPNENDVQKHQQLVNSFLTRLKGLNSPFATDASQTKTLCIWKWRTLHNGQKHFTICFDYNLLSYPAYVHTVASLASDIIDQFGLFWIETCGPAQNSEESSPSLSVIYFGGRIHCSSFKEPERGVKTRAFITNAADANSAKDSFAKIPTWAWIRSFLTLGMFTFLLAVSWLYRANSKVVS